MAFSGMILIREVADAPVIMGISKPAGLKSPYGEVKIVNPLFVGIDVSSKNNVDYLMKPDGSKHSSFSFALLATLLFRFLLGLVGQEKLKTALLLNLVEPRLGGVLIQGEKGTAKSTAVRGLAELMDEVEVAEGCPFHCRMDGEALCDECRSSPARRAVPYRRRVVELPVSATEDRVVGTLDLERALKEGVRAFEPGLLAQANGNILYVDEINLLEDHIVDVLLDSAAMGVNTVEREGISYSHPARFILVGTMNPEEATS